jgi:hypothetical protein
VQLLDFGNRFLNYKAIVRVISNHDSKILFQGMFVDTPFRILKFADIVKIRLDENDDVISIYITGNSTMFYNTQPHFIESI